MAAAPTRWPAQWRLQTYGFSRLIFAYLAHRLAGMVRLPSIACLIALTTLACFPGTAAGEEPRRLSPSGGWVLDYADDSCRLARQFGDGNESIILAMDRFEPGNYFLLSLIGHPLGRVRSGRDATLRFGPAELEQNVEFLEASTGDVPTMIFSRRVRIAPLSESELQLRAAMAERDEGHLFRPAPLDPRREQAVQHLYLDAPGLSPILLETGSLGEPFAAFRRCIDELLTHWGIDVEKHRSLTREATPTQPPASWITASDYPTRALRRGEQSIVHFRVTVDTQGQVSDCHIQRSTSGGEDFRQAACDAITRRARFAPALDAEGNPIRSYYADTIVFMIRE